MIKEITVYTVICDNCQADSNEDSGFSGWNDKEFALDIAKECGFIEHEGKHYCENCWSHDDDGEIIINKSRKIT